jgi:hypothetical protein
LHCRSYRHCELLRRRPLHQLVNVVPVLLLRLELEALGLKVVDARANALLIEEKVASGTTLEDAETLAAYARLARDTNGFNDFVKDAMA